MVDGTTSLAGPVGPGLVSGCAVLIHLHSVMHISNYSMSGPPDAVRATIEKTVQYVKKNGASFEDKLRQNDTQGKFAFLDASDPHHAYYKSLLESALAPAKAENGKAAEPLAAPDTLLFATELPPVSAQDLEIIKAVARYVASNSDKHGESFHRHMERTGKRSQFAFMNRKHTLYGLFQNYVRQYRAILDRAQGKAVASIDRYLAASVLELYTRAYTRAAYEKKHKIEQKSRESEERAVRLHYASIDWQDFTFVAKVNFDAVDEVSELAVPLLREAVMYRLLQSRSKEIELETAPAAAKDEEKGKEKENGENGENGENHNGENGNERSVPGVPKGMKIRAAGESRLKRKREGEKLIQCPITGKQIPELQFDTHLKVLLRDPRYQEQQDNFVKKNFTYLSNLTTDQVYENIKRLVSKRTRSEEEEVAQKKVNIGPQI